MAHTNAWIECYIFDGTIVYVIIQVNFRKNDLCDKVSSIRCVTHAHLFHFYWEAYRLTCCFRFLAMLFRCVVSKHQLNYFKIFVQIFWFCQSLIPRNEWSFFFFFFDWFCFVLLWLRDFINIFVVTCALTHTREKPEKNTIFSITFKRRFFFTILLLSTIIHHHRHHHHH